MQDVTESILSTHRTSTSAGIRTFDIHTYLASYSCMKFVFGIDADRGLLMLHFPPLGNLKKNQALVSMHYDWRPKIAQDIDSVDPLYLKFAWCSGVGFNNDSRFRCNRL